MIDVSDIGSGRDDDDFGRAVDDVDASQDTNGLKRLGGSDDRDILARVVEHAVGDAVGIFGTAQLRASGGGVHEFGPSGLGAVGKDRGVDPGGRYDRPIAFGKARQAVARASGGNQCHRSPPAFHSEFIAFISVGKAQRGGEPDTVAVGDVAAAALDRCETPPPPVKCMMVGRRAEQRQNRLGAPAFVGAGMFGHILVAEDVTVARVGRPAGQADEREDRFGDFGVVRAGKRLTGRIIDAVDIGRPDDPQAPRCAIGELARVSELGVEICLGRGMHAHVQSRHCEPSHGRSFVVSGKCGCRRHVERPANVAGEAVRIEQRCNIGRPAAGLRAVVAPVVDFAAGAR